MIDAKIQYEAMEKVKGPVWVLYDSDCMLWCAFSRRESDGEPMILLVRKSKGVALREGKKWLEYKKNPVKCCGREIPCWAEKRCLCCGEDYR